MKRSGLIATGLIVLCLALLWRGEDLVSGQERRLRQHRPSTCPWCIVDLGGLLPSVTLKMQFRGRSAKRWLLCGTLP